ncbi:MAG: hypothetical protein AAB581_03070 [Patescibacteria group bacterium]
MVQKIVKFFDRAEDKARGALSRRPLAYAFVGGVGVVLFWRGVWHAADDYGLTSFASIVIGIAILLITGLFVSIFIGDRIILSGLRGEKKLAEKTEQEVRSEQNVLQDIKNKLDKVEREVESMNHPKQE